MKEKTKLELRQLPFMLGKLLGGILAVVGFGAAAYIYTHKFGIHESDIMPYILIGIAGLVIFIVSSRLLSKKKNEKTGQ